MKAMSVMSILKMAAETLISVILALSVGFVLAAVGGYIMKKEGITISLTVGANDAMVVCEDSPSHIKEKKK
jgi:hypothetical protein